MPVPKSVTKIKVKKRQTNLEFTDFSDQASYMLPERTRAALRDVGKLISQKWNEVYYSNVKQHM